MKSIYLANTQIHSNTVDLGFVVFIPITGLDFPLIRLTKYDKPGEHGSIIQTQFYGGRPIILTGRVSGATPTQYLQNRRKLTNLQSIILDSLNNAQPVLLSFTTLDNLALQCYVYASDPIQIVDKSLNHGNFTIKLFAPDPNLYDQSLQLSTISMPAGGGATYPVIYPITYAPVTGGNVTVTNSGNSYMSPLVTFNGPLTTPFINNLTTGQVFKINVALIAGDTMVVDMASKTMLLNGNNGLQYFDSNNSWISLAGISIANPSGQNIISLGSSLSSDSGNVVIASRNSWIGV